MTLPIPYLNADGSYDRRLILIDAHRRAKAPRADWQAPATYAERLGSALQDLWVLARARRLIWQIRQQPADEIAAAFAPKIAA